MRTRTIRIATYSLLATAAGVTFIVPRTLTIPDSQAASTAAQIRLPGIARDFASTHDDFQAVADLGLGHYAGNVAYLLGDDGAPLQVHGVNDFSIAGGRLIPGVPYAARATVLGAEITSGVDPIPVTVRIETDTLNLEPFGAFADPETGSVNDAGNPRDHTFTLDEIYSAATPIAVTATSWLETTGSSEFGNHTIEGSWQDDADNRMIATKMTVASPGTITSISAQLETDNNNEDNVRYAIYSDVAGEPGVLVAETAVGISPDNENWLTLAVPPTVLAAGDYWLALCMDNIDQNYNYRTTGGTTRYRAYAADDSGYPASWGTSDISSDDVLAIYATYTPDAAYSEHMTVSTAAVSPYVKILRNGDPVPADIPAMNDQSTILDFVEDYVDLTSGEMTLQDNQAIYLFELGTTDLMSSAADFQDLVMLVTLATDPVYFASTEVTSDGTNPVGYQVVTQWTDSGGRNIAPHVYSSSAGDSAGTKGDTSSGGVTSPASFYQWFRDVLGTNQSLPHDVVLTDDGFGVFEYHSDSFFPLDDRLYGNEGGSHNHHFTYAVAARFTYDAGTPQFVEFRGGDGAWLFIDGELALDLGGVQTTVSQHLDLHRLGLTDGATYDFALFYADRHDSGSVFHLRTTVGLNATELIGSVTAPFD